MVVRFFVAGHISTQRLRKFFLAKEINPEDSGRGVKEDDEDEEEDFLKETALDTEQSCLEVWVVFLIMFNIYFV